MTHPTAARPARLTVGLIGAGRAGSVVAAALARAGHQVVSASAVSADSRARAAALIPQAVIADPVAVAAGCELLIVAVPDDVMPELVAGLCSTGSIRAGQFVVHLSGRHGIEVLERAAELGAHCLALHPAMTLTGAAYEVDRFDGCPFAVSSSDELRPVAEALVLEMGGEPEWITAQQRVMYHAALCHASNHLVTLIAQSQDLLKGVGVASPGRYLGPLLSATLDNALRASDAALTGPVSRGDAGTVGAHLAAISDVDDSASVASIARTYAALATATAIRAHDAGRITAAQTDAVIDAVERSSGTTTGGSR